MKLTRLKGRSFFLRRLQGISEIELKRYKFAFPTQLIEVVSDKEDVLKLSRDIDA